MLSDTKVDDTNILNKIDTTESAKFFSELLEKDLTFFLNGEWGIGKTEFLKEVENCSCKKFVDLNLWAIKDERTVITIAFTKLYPMLNILLNIFFIVCVVLSILVTPVVKENLWNFLPGFFNSKIVIAICTITTLFVLVWKFFKYKTDYLYYKFLNCNKTKFLLKKKVLVIDDFDRISEKNQEDAYKLFNCLNGNLPIIFVGDYSKIINMESKYLEKIIDRKVELPISLYPISIWEEYFKNLNNLLSFDVSQPLINLFIEEHRNLRERSMFHCYVMQELIQKNKKGCVQINQQLAIIYLYLFHPLEYMNVILKKNFDDCIDDKNQNLKPIKEILSKTEGYPKAFIYNRQGYYIYEKVEKLTESEALSILKGSSLKKIMVENGDADDDFYYFVSTKYNELETELKERLLDCTLKNICDGNESLLMYFVITNEHKKKYTGEVLKDNEIRDSWIQTLNEYNFDCSQIIYFLRDYLSKSFNELGKMYDHLNLTSKEFKDGKKKKYYFLTFLSNKKKWDDYNWDKSYWEAMDIIFSENYLDYLEILRSIQMIDVNFETKEIIVYDELFNTFDEKAVDNVGMFLENIKPNINKLKHENFTINHEKSRNVYIKVTQ